MPPAKKPLEIVGWREWISLPDLGIDEIKAKVDTGARTSTLHAFRVETFRKNNILKVRFYIHPVQGNTKIKQICVANVIDERMVSDSGGHREMRIIIESHVMLGMEKWPIEITLTNRDNMRFRMLLGRTAMRGRIMVNPKRSYIQGKPGSTLAAHAPKRIKKVAIKGSGA